jgi:membrane-associated protein
MDLLRRFVDIFLHLDTHLSQVIAQYGTGTHLILFLIVFCETGLVVTPFLPGDSLLFAAGTFAALGALDLWLVITVLIAAAIVGDTVNYWVGAYVGPRAFSGNVRFLRREYLERTQEFYQRHGGKTIIIARFIPIIRTFAPFVAGIGTMSYPRFITYNVVGAVGGPLRAGRLLLRQHSDGAEELHPGDPRDHRDLRHADGGGGDARPTTAGMTSRFLVSGIVQGVGFRWYVARHARGLGLTGFARNLPDGRVEVVAAGADRAGLDRLEALLRAGPAHAQVERVEREDGVAQALPSGSFDIR